MVFAKVPLMYLVAAILEKSEDTHSLADAE